MRLHRNMILAPALAAVLGGGVGLAVAANAAGGTEGPALADAPKAGAVASQTLMQKAFAGPTITSLPESIRTDIAPHTQFYGLQASAAKSVPAPPGAKDATWTVIPGTRGICFSLDGDTSLACGNADGFAAGTVLLTTQPSGEGPVPRDATSIDKLQMIGPGPARLDGIVPADFTRVNIIDASGENIATAPVVGGAYEVKAPDARAAYSVQLEKTDGSKVTIPH